MAPSTAPFLAVALACIGFTAMVFALVLSVIEAVASVLRWRRDRLQDQGPRYRRKEESRLKREGR